ncbi:MAG: methylenetetrahydrofolate--tRNA-(uracil(54)-C(5))-methyltransferase (FADH(2)-oxidizing) TrmFO [Verrucomicrobiota bacterium]
MQERIVVVGAGLAGSEAAWQIARQGIGVELFEMRPGQRTPAHATGGFAELVCSNSLGSSLLDRPTGLLQEELRRMGSLLMEVARSASVPAGGALAVDREQFAEAVTRRLTNHPLIEIRRERVDDWPAEGVGVIATGPLTAEQLSETMQQRLGECSLHFYDAMAPIVDAETLDTSICFRASRYGRGEQEQGDYINCPMNRDEYERFVRELETAGQVKRREFERKDKKFFEACLPVEELARRGERTLAFGPLRPKGLTDPRTGDRPYAVVQLRQDNAAGSLYNLVGFQTSLTYAEQDRVFRLIPGLATARFIRYGQMHRNTFLNAPRLLDAGLQLKTDQRILMAGQLVGAEGYAGSIGTGLLAGINAVRHARAQPPLVLPAETMLGSLTRYLTSADSGTFQPMKANFGLLPPLVPPVRNKRDRQAAYSERALEALTNTQNVPHAETSQLTCAKSI